MRFIQTLLAFLGGAVAALMWLERQTSSERPTAGPTPSPAPSPPPEPERVVERVVEEVAVPDPEQASRIEQLEAELAEQRALRTPEPSDPHPGVDAIRAARMRALELERQLSQNHVEGRPRWFEIDPPPAEDVIEAAAEHLPLVALWVRPDLVNAGQLWRALGAMQEFADASGGAWFEFDGDFAGWCRASGHAHALDPDQVGEDEARPQFPVDPRVNRSGRMAVPTYVQLETHRLHYIDDIAGETGRMHVFVAKYASQENTQDA